MSGQWSCSICTFTHQFSASRCSMCNSIRLTGIAKQVLQQENRSSDESEKKKDVVTEGNARIGIESKEKQNAKLFNPYTKKSISIEMKPQQNKGEKSNKTGSVPFQGQPLNQSSTTNAVFNPYLKKAPISNDIGLVRSDNHTLRHNQQDSQMMNSNSSRNMSIVNTRSNPYHPEKSNQSVHNNVNLQKDGMILPESSSHPSRPAASHELDTKRKKQKTLSFTNNSQSKRHEQESIVESNIPLDGYIGGHVPICKEYQSTWIYPQSDKYAERKYQLSISRTAIMHDTLVSLPTGLGKTLIASVVMYNFYRWFPTGKVVFLAPTRPLVTQQIEACFNIMGIPETDTAEMSGRNKQENRERLWKSRRCFFCTPQTFEKDLEDGRCDAKLVTCLVLDEAHKATGSYAYVNVVNQLLSKGAKFRLLGLSATPGKDLKSIKKVVETLKISKIEARVEDDDEVKPYTHDKQLEIIKIDFSSAAEAVDKLLEKIILPRLQQLRESNQMGSYRGSDSRITAFNLLTCMQARQKLGDNSMIHHFLVIQSLLRARDALREAGIGLARTRLLQFMKDHGNRGLGSAIAKEDAFLHLWRMIVKAQESGESFSQDTAEDLKMNNAKLQKLDEILHEHFARSKATGDSSRAIVFSQWRDSVEEIVRVLKKSTLIKPSKFVGQGSGSSSSLSANNEVKQRNAKNTGMNQKEQQHVIQKFKSGIFNCLVCTCIGEEGLDIGSVDLIVNFDCLRSPIRMVQRTGRTGRKRKGRVVCLVSKGQEERKLENSEQATKMLWKALRNPKNFTLSKSVPLLPVQPILERRVMKIPKEYRLSQIGGHSHRKKQRDSREEYASGVWWLSDKEEVQRLREFGEICSFDSNIRRIYVKKWNVTQLVSRPRGATVCSQILVELMKKTHFTPTNDSTKVGTSSLSIPGNNTKAIINNEPESVEIIPSYEESDNDDEDNVLFSPDSTLSHVHNQSEYLKEISSTHNTDIIASQEDYTYDVFGSKKKYSIIGKDVLSIVFGSSAEPSIFSKSLNLHQNTIPTLEMSNAQNTYFDCIDTPNARIEREIDVNDNNQNSEINKELTNNEEAYEIVDELACEDKRTSEINELVDTPNRCLESNGKSEDHGSLSDSPIRVIKGNVFSSKNAILTDSPNPIKTVSYKAPSSHDGLVDTPLCARNSKDQLTSDSLADTPVSIEVAPPKDSHLPSNSIQAAKIVKKQKLEKIKKLQKKNMPKGVANFFDLEADASETDDDDDEEEDFSQDSFINDSSQLSYTQVGSSFATQSTEKKDRNSISMYRRLNNSNTLNDLFSTPLLNRRSKSSDFSCPSSDVHLGKMNFIRSVIQHHQRGGTANELEKQYNTIIHTTDTPTEKSENKSTRANAPHSKPPIKLTAEQMARVEANRREALLRRQAASKRK